MFDFALAHHLKGCHSPVLRRKVHRLFHKYRNKCNKCNALMHCKKKKGRKVKGNFHHTTTLTAVQNWRGKTSISKQCKDFSSSPSLTVERESARLSAGLERKVPSNFPSTEAALLTCWCLHIVDVGTVDGRNPAPVDMVSIPLSTWFYTSQVVQDFFHQQYLNNWSARKLACKNSKIGHAIKHPNSEPNVSNKSGVQIDACRQLWRCNIGLLTYAALKRWLLRRQILDRTLPMFNTMH